MTAARQQRGQELEQTLVRVPADLLDWLREYARSQSPPISLSMATTQAIESLKATHSE